MKRRIVSALCAACLLLLFFSCEKKEMSDNYTKSLPSEADIQLKEQTENTYLKFEKLPEIILDEFPFDFHFNATTTDYIGEPIFSGTELYFYFYHVVSQPDSQSTASMIAKYDAETGKLLPWSEIIHTSNVIWDENCYAYTDVDRNLYIHEFATNHGVTVAIGEGAILERIAKDKIVYSLAEDSVKQYHFYDLIEKTEMVADVDRDAVLLAFDADQAYFAYPELDKGITVLDIQTGATDNYPISLPTDHVAGAKLHPNRRATILMDDKLYATLSADRYEDVKHFRQLVCLSKNGDWFECRLLENESVLSIEDRTHFHVYSYKNHCLFEVAHPKEDGSREFCICELNAVMNSVQNVKGVDYTNQSHFYVYNNVLCVYSKKWIDNQYVIYLQPYEMSVGWF